MFSSIKHSFVKIIFLFVVFYSPIFSSEYYEGDGGKDITIEIQKPDIINIMEDSAWIPEFVINTLQDDITKYSSISVVDIQNIDRISQALARDESSIFSEDDFVEIGNFKQCKYMLISSITGKFSSYALSFKITDKETAQTIAAFNEPNCTFEDLESGKILKEAVADLFIQLDVKLTEKGKDLLLAIKNVGIDKSVEVQKLVAKANVTEDNIESLILTTQATLLDNSSKRAKKAKVKSYEKVNAEGIGTDVRNKIELRKKFKKIIDDEREYYVNNPPYTFIYDTSIRQLGINYEKETYNVGFDVVLIRDYEIDYTVESLENILKKQPDYYSWELSTNSIYPRNDVFAVEIELMDENGKIISSVSESFDMQYSNFCDKHIIHTLPADIDTENLKINIKNVIDYNNSEKIENFAIYTRDDYLSEVLTNYLVQKPTGISDVNVISLFPSLDWYNNLKYVFNYPDLYGLAKTKYKLVKKNDIVFTSDELKILERKNIRTDNFYVTNTETSFPRIKEEFKKRPLDYVKINFKKIGKSQYKFLEINNETLDLLESVYPDIGNTTCKEYVYYTTLSDSFFNIFNFDSQIDDLKVEVFSYDNIIPLLTKKYPKIKEISKDNFEFQNPDTGDILGKQDEPLKDYVSYYNKIFKDKNYVRVQLNNESKSIILPYYITDPMYEIINYLNPKDFIPGYMITTKIPDEKIIEILKQQASSYSIENSPAIFANALNKIAGTSPFALDKNKESAFVLKDIVTYDYNCNGFMLPTDEQLEKFLNTNPREYKKLEKEAKKNNNEFLFFVFKKE